MLYLDLFFSYDLDYHLVKLNDYDDDRDDGHTIINTNAINNTLTSTIPQATHRVEMAMAAAATAG